MQTFTLTILAFYSRNPAVATREISHRIGVPGHMVRQARAWLGSAGYLHKDKDKNWHITDYGYSALARFDREKAEQNARFLNEAIDTAAAALKVTKADISGFYLMDKGMTNDSYIFYCSGRRYIYRHAGQGSEMLVDRYREYANYLVLADRGISDVVIYHNPVDGTKITEFLEDSKGIDPANEKHLERALIALRKLHNADIVSPHDFDFMQTIEYYEEICRNSEVEFYPSYHRYKTVVSQLLNRINHLKIQKCFCHIDFVPGNCLLTKDGKVTLIDWEYSGRQDPVADVAMFCISAAFNKKQSDGLLQKYLQHKPTIQEYTRFYTYIATAGLMWSLWSEFKTASGEVFEGYTERTFNLCKKYSKLANRLFEQLENN